MTYLGELISIGVAFSWTATALLSEFGSKRLGNLTLNVLRMALTLLFSLVLFMVVMGNPLSTMGISAEACGWMLLSGLVGYVIGDFCLFQCYIIIGSRFGQLFMTLAPLSAALMAWVTLGQQMTLMNVVAMLVTLFGIGISVIGRASPQPSPRGEGAAYLKSPSVWRGWGGGLSLKLPLNGVLFAIGAAVCQGVGLVLSKIGMDHYEVVEGMPDWLVPFSANFYRCIAGIIGFLLLLCFRDGMGHLREAIHDKKGLSAATATTIFGPFVGVGFSLMAVQYTGAGIASTLMAMTPIIILLPSHWLFHEKITWRAVIGAFISVIGVSLFFME